ncbi:MAG: diguanylate cyclase [Gemmatimonadetes bacterium]|nr:MAG: diguanylate cyclase [Gemmatimonadota bacterium]
MNIKQPPPFSLTMIAGMGVIIYSILSLLGLFYRAPDFIWQLSLTLLLSGTYGIIFGVYPAVFLRGKREHRTYLFLFVLTNLAVQLSGGFHSYLILFYLLLALLAGFRYHFGAGLAIIAVSSLLEGSALFFKGTTPVWNALLVYMLISGVIIFLLQRLFQQERQAKETAQQYAQRIEQDIQTIRNKPQSNEVDQTVAVSSTEDHQRLLNQRLRFQTDVKRVLTVCKFALQGHTAALFLYDPQQEQFTLRAIHTESTTPITPEAAFSEKNETLGWVAREKRGLLINHLGNRTKELVYYQQVPDVQSLIAVPIQAAHEPVDGILVIDATPKDAYSPAHREQAEHFAQIIAQFIQKYQEHEQNRRNVQYLNALYEISRMFTANLRPDETLHLLADITRKIVLCDGLVISSFDEHRQLFITEVVQGEAYPFLPHTEFALDGGLTGWIITHQKPLLLNDLQQKENRVTRFYRTEPPYPFRSFLGVPLRTRHNIVGALVLEHKAPHMYNEDTLQIVQILANLVAMTLTNYSLFAEVERLARTDGLTGLLTHAQIQVALDDALQEAHKKRSSLALLLIDIDQFHEINQKEGFSAGDLILKDLAQLVRDFVGKYGHVGRFSGDQFCALLRDATRERALELAIQLHHQIVDHTFMIDKKRPFHITVSIGLVHYPSDASTKIGMIEFGKEALQQAKALGKNRVQWYNTEMETPQQ